MMVALLYKFTKKSLSCIQWKYYVNYIPKNDSSGNSCPFLCTYKAQ